MIDVTAPAQQEKSHPEVVHPRNFLSPRFHLGRLSKVNDWAASHLAVAFGLVWTVWFFMIWPLALLLTPKAVQDRGFFLSSGWVQLWALPLFVYVGNKLQKSADAQSDAQHAALTHIAIQEDMIQELIEQNTALTQQIQMLTQEIHSHITAG